MPTFDTQSTLKTMLDMKLSVGQVLAGSFTTVVTVVAVVIYVHSTFQSRTEADKEHEKIMKRVEKVEDGFASQSKVQTEIYGDVKKISGILEAQMAEKSARNH